MNSSFSKVHLSTSRKAAITSLYVILIMVTVLGNLLVVRAFSKFANLRTVSNTILVSLAVADMLMVFVFILHITNIQFPRLTPRHQLCSVASMLNLTVNAIIILHLALISVERFLAIKYALSYHTLVTHRRAIIASAAVWFWGISISMIFPESLKADGLKTFKEFLQGLTPCFVSEEPFFLHSESVQAYLVFLVVALLVMPIGIIVTSYSYIFRVAWKQRIKIQDGQNSHLHKIFRRREMKGAWTVAIVVGLCLVSFIPLLVTLCLHFLNVTTVKIHQMHGVYFAASMNAWWNPLIYCWRNESFRRNIKRLLKCCPHHSRVDGRKR